MKISNSSITMASAHQEASFTYKETMTMEAAASKDVAGAILSLSTAVEGKSLKESMMEYQKQQKEDALKRQSENNARALQQMAEQLKANKENKQYDIQEGFDDKIKMLRKMLAFLRGEKVPEDCKTKPYKGGNNHTLDLRSAEFRQMDAVSIGLRAEAGVSLGSMDLGTSRSGTVWQRITATSGFVTESESTTFASKGLVQTADGRSIDFNIEVSMLRAFMCKYDMLEVQEYIKTDPLVINLDSNIASVSDQKFYFDLDADGKEEKISFSGRGSGFLALDKNGDGKINDGSELFGTQSGDGFKDLAAYDEDGNGWIDENDSVFADLKVWTKDEQGRDILMDLKKADVGAIYLGNADTQFALKNDAHQLNAEIKKTGIYLKESTGSVGTLNHVDLAI